MKLFEWDTEFNFGKFKGQTLKNVYAQSPNYIYWSIEKVEWFCITDEVFKNLTEIKSYNVAEAKFLVFGNQIYQDEMSSLEKFYSHLLKIHTEKLNKICFTEDSNFNQEFEGSYNNDWLADASGTDDSETMNDVYWNLD